jgi:hypothetical protein
VFLCAEQWRGIAFAIFEFLQLGRQQWRGIAKDGFFRAWMPAVVLQRDSWTGKYFIDI